MFVRRLAAILLLSFATACSSGGGGGPAGHIVPKAPDSYKPASCKLDKFGPEALFANAGKVDRVDSGYFEKRYNRPDLEAIANASIYSSSLYLNAIGANLSAVSSQDADDLDARKDAEDCYTYQFLPKPSDKLMETWEQAVQQAAGMGGTVQGLYKVENGPQILIARGADRWTLVHEMMHYNFDKTRRQEGEDLQGTVLAKLEQTLDDFKKHIGDYEKLPNRRDLHLAADDVEKLVTLIHRLQVQSFLEEVSIEAMLIDRYFEKNLGYVSRNAVQGAVWYIVKSKENAMDAYSKLDPFLDGVEKYGNDNYWPEVAERMQKSRDSIKAVAARVDEIVKIAEERAKVLETKPVPRPKPTPGGEERVGLASMHGHRHAMEGHVPAIVTSPRYKAFERELVRIGERLSNQ